MASIEKRVRDGDVRWYARFRDPSGDQKVKVFPRRVDAERYLTTVEVSKLTGSYIDAKRASITFRAFAEEHWAAYSHTLAADTTRPHKRSVLDTHILPTLGTRPLGTIKPSTVAGALGTWSRTLAPGTIGQVLRQVRQILDAALADGLVSSNAAKMVKPPTAPRRRDVHLTDDDVAAVIAATPEDYQSQVITLTGAGLRISEACGLRVDDIVLAALAEQVRRWPRQDGLVFSSSSRRPLTKASAGHAFDQIERHVGFIVSPHSLRHYFGASLMSRGVSVVAMSKWLGHSSPEIIYRVYAYLKPDDEAAGREAIAKTMRQVVPLVYPVCAQKGAQ